MKSNDFLVPDYVIKEKIAHIKMFLTYLKEDLKNESFSLRDFDAIEEIVDTAMCYGIDLEKEYFITPKDMLLMSSIIFEHINSIYVWRYDRILNKINDYHLYVSRPKL